MKFKTGIIIATCLLLIFPLLTYGGETNKNFDKRCLRVATMTEWPTSNQGSSYEVLLKNLLIQIPEGPKRISTINDSLIIFNKNGSVLHFDPISVKDLSTAAYPEGITINSKFTVTEAGQIPFEKTINDPTPTKQEDLAVWQDAMENKKEIFGDSNKVYKSEKENLIVYYYESPAPPLGSYASVHDLTQADTFLHVAAQNMSFDEFKKIVGSIQLR